MKCDIRTTIGLAIIAALAGVGVTLAMLKDIQLRTGLFPASASAPGKESAQVASDRPSDGSSDAPEARSPQAPASPDSAFEVSRSALKRTEDADSGEDSAGQTTDEAGKPDEGGSIHARASPGSAPYDTPSGETLDHDRSEFGPSDGVSLRAGGRSPDALADASGGEGDRASSEDSAEEKSNGDGGTRVAASSEQGDEAERSKADQSSGAAEQNQGAEKEETAENSETAADPPKLKSLEAVDYSEMSNEISEVSNTLERFNQKLLRAIGQAKKEAQSGASEGEGEAPSDSETARRERSAGEDGEPARRLPEINIEFEDPKPREE